MIDVIYLLTDFGLTDYYVSSIKSTIISINPKINHIIDISHNIEPWNIYQGAFILWEIIHDINHKSIIIGVVDPGVGFKREDIVIECKNNIFLIGPNNGLLYPAANVKNIEEVYEIDISNKQYFPRISRTFYGRDVYAKTAGYISIGVKDFLKKVSKDRLLKLDLFPEMIKSNNKLKIKVLHVDRFGNIITNIRCESMKLPDILKLYHKNIMIRVRKVSTYSELKDDEIGILCGSRGLYEITMNKYNASLTLGIKPGSELVLEL